MEQKTPRKRVANFTPIEKDLLIQLIKKQPIIESKFTDYSKKAIAKKQVAWDLVTQEFNSNPNVIKRETITLKRAWDNMKASTKKASTKKINLVETGSPTQAPLPQYGMLLNMVEEAHAMLSKIKNALDSEGIHVNSVEDNHITGTPESISTIKFEPEIEISVENYGTDEENKMIEEHEVIEEHKVIEEHEVIEEHKMIEENKVIEENNVTDERKVIDGYTVIQENTESNSCNPSIHFSQNSTDSLKNDFKKTNEMRRPKSYVYRESVMKYKHLVHKHKMEMQILKTQLEVQQIQKNTALLEEEKSKVLLEKAKAELEAVINHKNNFNY